MTAEIKTKEKTLLVIAPGERESQGKGNTCFVLLVAKTGEGLASHVCSGSGYAEGDLYYNRNELVKKLKDRFGEVEVKFIDETDIGEEEMLRRNREWHEREKAKGEGQ